jgi:hypothetical protein
MPILQILTKPKRRSFWINEYIYCIKREIEQICTKTCFTQRKVYEDYASSQKNRCTSPLRLRQVPAQNFSILRYNTMKHAMEIIKYLALKRVHVAAQLCRVHYDKVSAWVIASGYLWASRWWYSDIWDTGGEVAEVLWPCCRLYWIFGPRRISKALI